MNKNSETNDLIVYNQEDHVKQENLCIDEWQFEKGESEFLKRIDTEIIMTVTRMNERRKQKVKKCSMTTYLIRSSRSLDNGSSITE